MEAAVVNTLSSGDRVLLFVNGAFGERFAAVCKAYGVDARRVDVPWGRAVEPDLVRDELAKEKGIQTGDRVRVSSARGKLEVAALVTKRLGAMTVGIIGLGNVGNAVATRLRGFGCRVLHSSASGGVPLAELLEHSDFVTLHCPLTPETRGLIGDEALARMKPTAYLVNTARGPIVDTTALVRALHAGEIAGAALDVTDPEPLPGGHVLAAAPNTLMLPHLGSATVATREAMADMAVDNLLAALSGDRMPHCANPEVYDKG